MINDEFITTNKLLYEFYQGLDFSFRNEHLNVSLPHLIFVKKQYCENKDKLMIVGQQTFGWTNMFENDPTLTFIQQMIKTYEKFDLGKTYFKSPFWMSSHYLAKLFNNEEYDFIWTNLLKVDQNKQRPNKSIEDKICELSMLQNEIRITKPNVIVFFTGPTYDDIIQKTFPNSKIKKLNEYISLIEHDSLPKNSYRTYHPNFLMKKYDYKNVLNEIHQSCKQ